MSQETVQLTVPRVPDLALSHTENYTKQIPGRKAITLDEHYVFHGVTFSPNVTYFVPPDVYDMMAASVKRRVESLADEVELDRQRSEMLQSGGVTISNPTNAPGLTAEKIQQMIDDAVKAREASIHEEIREEFALKSKGVNTEKLRSSDEDSGNSDMQGDIPDTAKPKIKIDA